MIRLAQYDLSVPTKFGAHTTSTGVSLRISVVCDIGIGG